MKTLIYFVFLAGSHISIKVLKTTEKSPADSKGEILHSSLEQLDEFTVCGRFLTSVFSTKHHVWQNLLFRGQNYFLAAITLGENCGEHIDTSITLQEVSTLKNWIF